MTSFGRPAWDLDTKVTPLFDMEDNRIFKPQPRIPPKRYIKKKAMLGKLVQALGQKQQRDLKVDKSHSPPRQLKRIGSKPVAVRVDPVVERKKKIRSLAQRRTLQKDITKLKATEAKRKHAATRAVKREAVVRANQSMDSTDGDLGAVSTSSFLKIPAAGLRKSTKERIALENEAIERAKKWVELLNQEEKISTQLTEDPTGIIKNVEEELQRFEKRLFPLLAEAQQKLGKIKSFAAHATKERGLQPKEATAAATKKQLIENANGALKFVHSGRADEILNDIVTDTAKELSRLEMEQKCDRDLDVAKQHREGIENEARRTLAEYEKQAAHLRSKWASIVTPSVHASAVDPGVKDEVLSANSTYASEVAPSQTQNEVPSVSTRGLLSKGKLKQITAENVSIRKEMARRFPEDSEYRLTAKECTELGENVIAQVIGATAEEIEEIGSHVIAALVNKELVT